jgi:hypothetical protein
VIRDLAQFDHQFLEFRERQTDSVDVNSVVCDPDRMHQPGGNEAGS